MKIEKVRDLTIISLDDQKALVVACDSCGGVGSKEQDVLKVPAFITGKFTARVPLCEVLCAGAQVVCLTNAIANEMEPTGRQIIRGIEEELSAAGLSSIVLTGSTEKNFPTFTTGLGITVIGVADKGELKVNNVKADSSLFAIGSPKVGSEVLACKPGDIADYKTIKQLLATEGVQELVPVGSSGILHEAQELARNNCLRLDLNPNCRLDLKKSAGPGTVLLVAVAKHCGKTIQKMQNAEMVGMLSTE